MYNYDVERDGNGMAPGWERRFQDHAPRPPYSIHFLNANAHAKEAVK
jgi:hypothetical protein